MESPLLILFVKALFILVILQFQTYGSLGCMEEERNALLKLKDVFDYPQASVVSSWGRDGSDCCMWDQVKCDPIIKRVVQIFLNNTFEVWQREFWNLNFSLFLPLQELKNLSLAENGLKGFKGELRSSKLEYLDLSSNCLDEIPALGAMESLKFLNLEFNDITNLSHFEDLTNLKKLEFLNLGNNFISGNLPKSIGALTSLKALSFTFNELIGTLPEEALCKLRNLQELDLSINSLEGIIPSCLGNLTSLKFLNLSANMLVGTIPSTLFLNLRSLEYVSLSYNHFEGFSFSSFSENSKLEVFELESSNKELRVDTEFPPWDPLFKLKVFRLTNCRLNEPRSTIPSFLLNQSELRLVDLSHNSMVGEVPNWILTNNKNLESLSLRNNFLTGPLLLHPHSRNLDMFWLDISVNQVHGVLPPFIGHVVPKLLYLNISTNRMRGSIPSSVGVMQYLRLLDLANNQFSGEVPEQMLTGCVSLSFLRLSNNNLQGQLLPTKSNLTNLVALYVDDNYFSGELSPGLLNSSHLELLDLRNNSISGRIPDWISSFSNLQSLTLSKNAIEGHIPTSICSLQELRFLDISQNKLLGVIPSCANLSSLKYLHLQGNELTGPLPGALSKSSSLVTVDIRENKFSGEIPNWIYSLSRLRILLLKGNNFEGSIPPEICQLKNVTMMDLSDNKFSGLIPKCLSSMSLGIQRSPNDTFSTIIYVRVPRRPFSTYSYGKNLNVDEFLNVDFLMRDVEEEVKFISKGRYESYKGNILYFMSGIDLSCNNLTGTIPNELGYLSHIHTLNLSHNHLTGIIPTTFSNLRQIQSLDLSYNRLSSEIPRELIQLNFLEVFSVAYNNLSGWIPSKGQFATFDESSYEGNPLLIQPPPERGGTGSAIPQPAQLPPDSIETDLFGDVFWGFFCGSYIVAFIAIIFFLYLNFCFT